MITGRSRTLVTRSAWSSATCLSRVRVMLGSLRVRLCAIHRLAIAQRGGHTRQRRGEPMGQQSFGGELHRLRKQRGLSLKKFAHLVHYDPGYLSKIENGLKPPTATLAEACDTALDTDGTLAALVPERAPLSRRWYPRGDGLGRGVVVHATHSRRPQSVVGHQRRHRPGGDGGNGA